MSTYCGLDSFDDTEIKSLMKQLLDVMVYMHSIDIIHRFVAILHSCIFPRGSTFSLDVDGLHGVVISSAPTSS
jgi:serine/threonine protein kinase